MDLQSLASSPHLLLAWLHDNVDQRQPSFVFDDAQRTFQGRTDGVGCLDGALTIQTIGLRHLGEIDRRVIQARPNAGVRQGALTHTG